MIIAAMPKTASTSLIFSLHQITGIDIKPHVEKIGYISEPYFYNELSRYHKSIYLKKVSLYETLLNSQEVVRDHILPEREGFDFLAKNRGMVFLVRNPEHIFDNYNRTANIRNPKRLLLELKTMYNRYTAFGNADGNLLIFYDDLITKPKVWLKKILKFLKIKAIAPIVLQKRKYTGVGERRLNR